MIIILTNRCIGQKRSNIICDYWDKDALLDVTLAVATMCPMEGDQHVRNTNSDGLDLVGLIQETPFCQHNLVLSEFDEIVIIYFKKQRKFRATSFQEYNMRKTDMGTAL